MTAMKFVLARRLGNSNTNIDDKEKDDVKMAEEHNLFNMPQQQDQNNQDIPPEDKIIDVHEDIENANDTSENQNDNNENQDNNENIQNQDERNDEKLGEVIENTNWENEMENDEQLKQKLRGNKSEEENQDEEMEFIFENIIPIYRHGEIVKYQTSVNSETLAELWDRGTIEYQGNLQRGYIKNKKGEDVAVYNLKHTKEILESILTQKIHGGFITLNGLNSKPLKFNPENMTLSILSKQKLQVLDGQHRLRAFSMWLKLWKRKPEQYISPKEFFIPVVIETLDEESAKSLFSEYATKPLKISSSRSLFLDVDSNINRIARRLMQESELKNRVEVVKNTVSKKSNKIVSFSVISKGIKNNFKPSTQRESDEIANHLILFFNELVNTFPEIMGDIDSTKRQELKEKVFTIDVLAFYAYFALSFEFYNKDNWKEKLNKLKDIVRVGEWEGEFLSKENPLFKPVLRENNRIINTSSTLSYMSKVIVGYVAQGKSIEELMSEK